MITFPANVQAELDKAQGTQPILVLEIDWRAGSTVVYSDATYSGASPSLISAGSINQTEGLQISNQINVVLDATTESVEAIFRNADLHLRPARLYLGYASTTERALLFEGLINSAITWDEGGRSLQFQILTKLEDALVAFTMEDGNFPKVSQDDRADVWPLPFGTVCHYKAQRLTTTIKGFLIEGVGAVDPTLATRICQIEKTQCPLVEVPGLTGGGTPGSGTQWASTTRVITDRSCLQRKRNESCVMKDLLAQQQALAASSFTVRGGEEFPQNKTIKIRVGQVSYAGVMSGTTFTVSKVFHPDVDKISECKNVRDPSIGWRYGLNEDDALDCSQHGSYGSAAPISGVDCITATSQGIGGNFYSSCGFNSGGSELQQGVVGGSGDSWSYYDSMPKGRFIWNPPGTDVVLQEFDDDLIYMVSLVPGTVTSVLSYREFGDQKVLAEVPTSWYSVQTVDYGGYTCVELRFNRLPSADLDNPGFSDDIIVSFVSSVGPSPVDIIEWLVDTYTDFTVDATNFAAVKSTLTEFDSNFVVQERKSVLQLINEIAYQQRMAVRITGGVVQLVYLGEEPTSLRTLTEADLLQSSFEISLTETEALRTNHAITWREQYNPNIDGDEVDKDIQLRFNIPKYGTSDESWDWFTQNTFDTVLKTTTFWLIRKSNTWQEVSFTTTLEHLDLEIYDCVTLNIDDFPSNTKVVIQEKQYNTEDNTVTYRAWTPIRAGEDAPYQWAWPAAVTVGNVWPTAGEDANVGDGSGISVTPPVGHPLRLGYSSDTKPVSTGDPFPSDVGFTAPTVTCEVPFGNEIVFATEPFVDPLAKQIFQEDVKNKESGNGGGVSISYDAETPPECSANGIGYCPPETSQVGDPPAEENLPVDENGNTPCRYFVSLNYITPTLIRNNGCSGPCKNENAANANDPGFACNGDFITVETVVNSYEAALNAVKNHSIQASYYTNNCAHEFGQTVPSVGTQVRTITSDGTIYYDTEAPADKCTALQIDEDTPPEIINNPQADDGSEDPPLPDVSP